MIDTENNLAASSAPELTDDEILAAAMRIDGFGDLWSETDGCTQVIKEVALQLAPMCEGRPKRVETIMAASPLVIAYLTDDPKAGNEVRRAIKSGVNAAVSQRGRRNTLPVTAPTQEPRPSSPDQWTPEMSVPADGSEYAKAPHAILHTVITRTGSATKTLIGQPVEIVSAVKNLDTGDSGVTIRFKFGDAWVVKTVPRLTLLDSKELMKGLVNAGLTVSSGDAAEASRYFAHILAYHQHNIPTVRATGRCGWRGNVFVLGNTTIGSRPEDKLTFAADATVENLIASLGPNPAWGVSDRKKKLAIWLEMAEEIKDKPTVVFALAASFLPPLLADLPALQNGIIDINGDSTAGKTTTLRMAASVWGNPADGADLLRPWKDTGAYNEVAAAAMYELPIFRDESKMADPAAVADWAFAYSNGSGKGRSTATGGIRASNHFKGIMLSTGEHPLTSYSTDNGVLARTVSITGSPLGDEQKPLADRINDVASHCFGLAGRAVLAQYIEARGSRKDELNSRYKSAKSRLETRAGGDALNSRLASVVAAVEAAGAVASDILGLAWDMKAVTDEVFDGVCGSRRVDSAQGAMDALAAYITQRGLNIQSVEGITPTEYPVPPDGTKYRIKIAVEKDGVTTLEDADAIALLPPVAARAIKDAGFSPEATLRQWKAKGWLTTDGDKNRNTRNTRIGVNPNRRQLKMIALSAAGMAAAFGPAWHISHEEVIEAEKLEQAASATRAEAALEAVRVSRAIAKADAETICEQDDRFAAEADPPDWLA